MEFISISPEEPKLVEEFLKTKEFKTAVCLDGNNKTFNTYGAHVIPHTVVIDADGNIAAIAKPDDVTEKVLTDLVANRKVTVPLKITKPYEPKSVWLIEGFISAPAPNSRRQDRGAAAIRAAGQHRGVVLPSASDF